MVTVRLGSESEMVERINGVPLLMAVGRNYYGAAVGSFTYGLDFDSEFQVNGDLYTDRIFILRHSRYEHIDVQIFGEDLEFDAATKSIYSGTVGAISVSYYDDPKFSLEISGLELSADQFSQLMNLKLDDSTEAENPKAIALAQYIFSGADIFYLTESIYWGDQVCGYAGNDTMYGYDGNDTLDGGAGSDVLVGGGGDDLYVVDSLADIVEERPAEGNDLVHSSVTYTLTANVEGVTLTGTGNINAIGNVLDNILTGNSGDNQIEGGSGNDILFGGAGRDTVSYATATSSITVSLAIKSAQITGGSGIDTIHSFENVLGSGFDDKLVGNPNNNILWGRAGNDTLIGGAGRDKLVGGTGEDCFIFKSIRDTSALYSRDVITDFQRGVDMIDLSEIDSDVVLGGNQAFTFIGSDAFTGVAGQLRFVTGVASGDVNGDAKADFSVAVKGFTALMEGDLIL